MGDVVNLAERRRVPAEPDEREPHLVGPARCLHCNHTWEAAAPSGTLTFECPVCSLMKGVRMGLCVPPPTEPVWVCCCGGDLFMLRKAGAPMCVRCGLVADGWVEEG
jgi:hypothetical protein